TVVGEVRTRPRTVDRRYRYDVGQPGGVVEGPRPGVARRGDDQGALGPRVVDRELDVRRAAERLVRAEGEVDGLGPVIRGPADRLGGVEGGTLTVGTEGSQRHQ